MERITIIPAAANEEKPLLKVVINKILRKYLGAKIQRPAVVERLNRHRHMNPAHLRRRIGLIPVIPIISEDKTVHPLCQNVVDPVQGRTGQMEINIIEASILKANPLRIGL